MGLASLRRLTIIAAIAALPLAGCTDYLERRDTLTLETGDAVQANIATHVIDPWPPHARVIGRDFDGDRAQRAIERYRNPQVGGFGGGSGGGAPTPIGASTGSSSNGVLAR